MQASEHTTDRTHTNTRQLVGMGATDIERRCPPTMGDDGHLTKQLGRQERLARVSQADARLDCAVLQLATQPYATLYAANCSFLTDKKGGPSARQRGMAGTPRQGYEVAPKAGAKHSCLRLQQTRTMQQLNEATTQGFTRSSRLDKHCGPHSVEKHWRGTMQPYEVASFLSRCSHMYGQTTMMAYYCDRSYIQCHAPQRWVLSNSAASDWQ